MNNRNSNSSAPWRTRLLTALLLGAVVSLWPLSNDAGSSTPSSESTTTVTVTVPESTTLPTPTTTPPVSIIEAVSVEAPPTTQAPPTTAAPTTTAVPTPAPVYNGPDGDTVTRGKAAVDSVVPAGWFGSAELQFTAVSGSTSRAQDTNPGLIMVGSAHAKDWDKLRFTMAHEWGHHVAFRYGDTSGGNGYPPVGFPTGGQDAVEGWANCVAEVLVPGVWFSSHGLTHCSPEGMAFTRSFLAAGPPH